MRILIFLFAMLLFTNCDKEPISQTPDITGAWTYLCWDDQGNNNSITYDFRLDGSLCETDPLVDPVCTGAWSEDGSEFDVLRLRVLRPFTNVTAIWEVVHVPGTNNVVFVTAITPGRDGVSYDVSYFHLLRVIK